MRCSWAQRNKEVLWQVSGRRAGQNSRGYIVEELVIDDWYCCYRRGCSPHVYFPRHHIYSNRQSKLPLLWPPALFPLIDFKKRSLWMMTPLPRFLSFPCHPQPNPLPLASDFVIRLHAKCIHYCCHHQFALTWTLQSLSLFW